MVGKAPCLKDAFFARRRRPQTEDDEADHREMLPSIRVRMEPSIWIRRQSLADIAIRVRTDRSHSDLLKEICEEIQEDSANFSYPPRPSDKKSKKAA